MYFYEPRVLGGRSPQTARLQLLVIYEHCLKLVGRQQGPLIYTLTLLPGEEVTLYEYDRFRRVRSDQQRVSVQTSFRQTMGALYQSSSAASASSYAQTLRQTRESSDVSASTGGLFSFFVGSAGVNTSHQEVETVGTGSFVSASSSRFSRYAAASAQSTEAERSVVISRFEEAEHREMTSRTFRNSNECHAVTYMVRRINEVYEVASRVVSVEWRRGTSGQWHSHEDAKGAKDSAPVKKLFAEAPKIGEEAHERERSITLPTDGTVYEPELAHCSSCEARERAEGLVDLELKRIEARKSCLEAELLDLELQRRRSAAAAGEAEALELAPWVLSPGASEGAPGHGQGKEVEEDQ